MVHNLFHTLGTRSEPTALASILDVPNVVWCLLIINYTFRRPKNTVPQKNCVLCVEIICGQPINGTSLTFLVIIHSPQSEYLALMGKMG